jgi:hypothetical protein
MDNGGTVSVWSHIVGEREFSVNEDHRLVHTHIAVFTDVDPFVTYDLDVLASQLCVPLSARIWRIGFAGGAIGGQDVER